MVLIAGSLITTYLLGLYLRKNTTSKLPFVDSFTTVFSLGATWLMITNIPDSWYYWVAINGVSMILYFKRDLKFGALLFLVYLLMSVDGCIESITWFEDLVSLLA